MNFYKLYRLLNEYGENLIQTLTKKFMEEEPALTQDIIRRYIDRFERIKNNLAEKDITKYSWVDLENAVDGYQGKEKIKAGKLDPTVSDANLLFNKDGIRIYLGKDKKSCIRYSNGYTFCIGARGEDNQYGYYRLNKKGTPYFIFNDNLPQSDKRHLMVLFVYLPSKGGSIAPYSVTLADNQGDKKYDSIEKIVSDFPWVSNLMPFLRNDKKGIVEPPALEYLEHYLKKCLDNLENSIQISFKGDRAYYKDPPSSVADSLHISMTSLIKDSSKQKLQEFLNDDAEVAFVRIYPVLFEAQIPVKDVKAAKEIVDRSEVLPGYGKANKNNTFIGLDFPRYFTFFSKNSSDLLKNIKQKVKYFLEEYQLEKDLDETMSALEQKEQTFQKLLENNKEIKKSLNNGAYIKSVENIISFSQLFRSSVDATAIPYLVIQVNNVKKEANKIIQNNKEEISRLYDGKNRYNKCLAYIKTLTTEQQQRILDFCHSDSIDNRPGSIRDLFDIRYDGCFVFKIIEYVMKNKDILNKNLNQFQISDIAQKVYYLKNLENLGTLLGF